MKKKQRNLVIVLFAIYILAITWIILFKMRIGPIETLYSERRLNLIPLAGSRVVNGAIDFNEIIYNIFAFIPLGIYISMLKPEWSILKKAAPGFLLSFSLETLQYILRIGSADITDLLGNTLGGILGIGVFFIFKKLFKHRGNIIMTVLASAATTVMVGLIGLIMIVNHR